MKVAVKKLRVQNLTEKELTEFRREASVMTYVLVVVAHQLFD